MMMLNVPNDDYDDDDVADDDVCSVRATAGAW